MRASAASRALHSGCDVIEDDLHTLDRSVGSAPRGDQKVEVPFLDSGTAEVGLQPPLGPDLPLAGVIDPVEHLEYLLALQYGVDVVRQHSHRFEGRIQCAVGRIDRNKSMVGTFQTNQHGGDVFEDAAYIISRTDSFVPALFGHHMAVPPGASLRTFQWTESKFLANTGAY